MKVRVVFEQKRLGGHPVSKTIDLAIIPTPGMYFEYEKDRGSVFIDGERLHVVVSRDEVSIQGRGPQFDDEDLQELALLGWDVPACG